MTPDTPTADSMNRWHHHPGVRTGSDLTLGERAADVMRNAMGSWPFVFTFIAIMALWMFVNSVLLGKVIHGKPFDIFPYVLLNLVLSTLAGLQGAILLIAAKRADQIASEQALHHLQISEGMATMLQSNTELTEQVKQDTALLHDIHDHIVSHE